MAQIHEIKPVPQRPSVLILFAHPTIQKSRINRVLVEAVRHLPGVTFRDLYEEYPDQMIDVKREQELLRAHDTIVFQHPFYWYSTPAILKEWMDLTLEFGFAYGEGGNALHGKKWVHAITTGGDEAAYSGTGSNRFTIEEFMRPLEQSAALCGMKFLPPFLTHSVARIDPKTDAHQLQTNYRKFIQSLQKDSKP